MIASRPREPGRQRRHRPRGVLGQHRHDRVDVAALHRVHVALDDLAQLLVAERAQRRLLAALGERARRRSCARAAARCSTDATVVSSDSATSLAEKPSTSRRISTARWVAGRCWTRGDERQLDALAPLVAGLRRGEAVLDAERARPGRARPRPTRRAARPAPSLRVGRRAVVERQHALGPPRDLVQAGVRRDRVEPRAQRAAALEARRGRATRAARPPAARPRRRGPSRASGSSGRAARRGRARASCANASSSPAWAAASSSCSRAVVRVSADAIRAPG